MAVRQVNIEASWRALLSHEFDEPYMVELGDFLRSEKQKGKRIYPPGAEIFAAFEATASTSLIVGILDSPITTTERG